MEYGVGITSVLPTELVAELIFNEKSVVGSNSARSHRPGPGIPAIASDLSNCASFSKCALWLSPITADIDLGAMIFSSKAEGLH